MDHGDDASIYGFASHIQTLLTTSLGGDENTTKCIHYNDVGNNC